MSVMDGPSALHALADAVGIVPEYFDQRGDRILTSDATRRAFLAALGHDARDEDAAAMSLALLRAQERSRVLTPVRVVSGYVPASVEACAPDHAGHTVACALRVRDESGREHVDARRVRVADDGTFAIPLPFAPTLGYYDVVLDLQSSEGDTRGTQTLIVTPPRCPSPGELLRGQRVFGLTANLYAVRSARNWGVGDLTDLATLLSIAADAGAAFVGVNPLHALRNAGDDVSPYSPVSRLYRNPLYLDVDAIPELANDVDARTLLASGETREALAALRARDRVDYEGVMRVKRRVLEQLHRTFRERASDTRRTAYDTWCAREGRALERHARFVAIDEHQRALGVPWWREWPAELQNATSSAVEAFAREHAEAVELQRWLQFELDRQLGEAARLGRERGLPLGVYQDLAIGSSPAGSDVWATPELFARGVSVGAPPDPLGPDGQNWGLPPLDPHRLAADGYRYWSALLRGAMRHGGALRIDHILGLFRQFWIPDGQSGRDGAYVRFPTEDLLGILALEAQRAGAIVVGEDLGTVPPEVGPTLTRWGVLSSKVLYFERESDGRFRAPRSYPRDALATANTHDLTPLAGWWTAGDLALRADVGLLRDDAEVSAARDERTRDRGALVALLVDEGVLAAETAARGPDAIDDLEIRAGVHALLRRAPSWLVGISLEDLVGEPDPVNVPGVTQDRFPSWTRRLRVSLETLRGDPAVRRALGVEREWVP